MGEKASVEMVDLYAIWSGFGAETKAAVIGALATAGTGFLGFAAIIAQIGAQGRANRVNIAENERRRLKAELYEETVAVCSAVSEKVTAFSTALRLAGQFVELSARAQEESLAPQIPNSRFPHIQQAHIEMVDAAIAFIFIIERRQIVDPRIMVFRTAMNVALHDANAIYNGEFVPAAIPILPAELPDGRLVFDTPSVDAALAFRDIAWRGADAAHNIGMCVEDFLVEMQNLLLGDLFETRAAHREPIDPAFMVIRLDRHEEIERHLSTQTAWGKQATRHEAEARARVATQNGDVGRA